MSKILLLQKKDKGRIEQVPCVIDFLASKDEYEACSFYQAAAELIGNPDIFVPDNTLPTDLANEGIVLGVRAENQLICVRILTFNRHTISEYKDILEEKLYGSVACSDGCIVENLYRGNNLQQLTWFMMEPLLHGKYDYIVATVSPKNIVSLKNLLACGFMIIARANMYGNFDRFILAKKLSKAMSIRTAAHAEINIHDCTRMMDLFSKGYVGYKMKHKSTGVYILLGEEIH